MDRLPLATLFCVIDPVVPPPTGPQEKVALSRPPSGSETLAASVGVAVPMNGRLAPVTHPLVPTLSTAGVLGTEL
jgi:hypothetical protein